MIAEIKNSVEDLENKVEKLIKIGLPKVVRKGKKMKESVEEFQKIEVIQVSQRETRGNKELLKTYSENIAQTIGIKFQRIGSMIGQQTE